MGSTKDVQLVSATNAEQRALRAVLRSATFAKNPRLAALLEYLCVRSFRGEGRSLKEYSIATDVFGRPADFDQSTDAIVRVEMHRLRKKLREFYAREGADEPIEIVIQSGQYVPEFAVRGRNGDPAASSEPTAREEPQLATSTIDQPRKSAPPAPPVNALRRTYRLAGIAAGLIALAFIVGFAIFTIRAPKRTPTRMAASPTSNKAVIPPGVAVPPLEGIHIMCGVSNGTYRDRDGNQWESDAFYSGGTAVEVTSQPIYRTRDPHLFRSMRSGEFTYKIPLKPGVYELRLYFVDTSYNPGPAMEGGENVRQFNVVLNGESLLRNFDIIADAGPNTADVRVFKDVRPAADGCLHLAFSKVTDFPLLNAIEILPGVPRHLRPIRIVTQDNTLIDRNGNVWSPDNFFLSGRSIARFGIVTGPDDPQIYERERYGNFSYAIPVAPGRYSVTLHFAETYWGPNAQGGGGAGSRIFDVFCNGTALLRNFDMFREAGSHHQLIKTFHDLQPNAQGKLLLSFVPVVNYANLSAIEVVDESE